MGRLSSIPNNRPDPLPVASRKDTSVCGTLTGRERVVGSKLEKLVSSWL